MRRETNKPGCAGSVPLINALWFILPLATDAPTRWIYYGIVGNLVGSEHGQMVKGTVHHRETGMDVHRETMNSQDQDITVCMQRGGRRYGRSGQDASPLTLCVPILYKDPQYVYLCVCVCDFLDVCVCGLWLWLSAWSNPSINIIFSLCVLTMRGAWNSTQTYPLAGYSRVITGWF